jgi:RNA polymerase sigma-70 factor (ECF subfamily)
MVNAQRGDEASYRRLLTRLGTVIENYVRSRLGPIGFEEDIVQESLLAIHKARHTYNPARPFRPWMFAIVRHKSVDMLRRQSRQAPPYDKYAEEATEQNRLTEPGADALIESEQLFSGMGATSRQALVLTKVMGLTMAEAATKLNISESAMKVRVHRALHELRRHLETMR